MSTIRVHEFGQQEVLKPVPSPCPRAARGSDRGWQVVDENVLSVEMVNDLFDQGKRRFTIAQLTGDLLPANPARRWHQLAVDATAFTPIPFVNR